jgi:signal transduction protein with GAF and PtsI domain
MLPGFAANLLLTDLQGALSATGSAEERLHTALQRILGHLDCAVGTIHSLEADSGMLRLCTHIGLPPILLERVQMIPLGKGMAGIAAQRGQPVQVCNLQTDTSGVARPAAKETRMEGSLSVPMLLGGVVRGTLGVAKPVPHEFSEGEIACLQEVANTLGRFLDGQAAP